MDSKIQIFFKAFFKSMVRPFVHYFDFKGRSNRMEMWAYAVLLLLLAVVQIGIFFKAGISETTVTTYRVMNSIESLALFIRGLALSVRRLYDLGYSGKTLLYYYIVFPLILLLTAFIATILGVGMIKNICLVIAAIFYLYLICIMYFFRGNAYRNQYGDPVA